MWVTSQRPPSSAVRVGKAPPGGHKKTRGFSVDTVCEKIMEDEGNWDCLSQFVRGILLEKRPDLDREVARSLDRAAG
ncbi:hypothetical protein J6590_030174 [Homalodisca vitripennis]|nr:hypothetical protein J6590_030174 [Homalodisca vitripennis]